MPYISTPLSELTVKYEKVLDQLEEVSDALEDVVREINFGDDLSEEGERKFSNLRHAAAIIIAAREFLPDTITKDWLA